MSTCRDVFPNLGRLAGAAVGWFRAPEITVQEICCFCFASVSSVNCSTAARQCGFVAFLAAGQQRQVFVRKMATFPVFVDRQDPWKNSNGFGNIFSAIVQDGHYLSKYTQYIYTYICLLI